MEEEPQFDLVMDAILNGMPEPVKELAEHLIAASYDDPQGFQSEQLTRFLEEHADVITPEYTEQFRALAKLATPMAAFGDMVTDEETQRLIQLARDAGDAAPDPVRRALAVYSEIVGMAADLGDSSQELAERMAEEIQRTEEARAALGAKYGTAIAAQTESQRKEALAALNQINDLTARALETSTRALETLRLAIQEWQTPTKPARPRTTALPDEFKFKNDNINRAALMAVYHAREMAPMDGLAYGYSTALRGLDGSVGIPEREQARALWETLRERGPSVVKMHYALWARWYEHDDPDRYVSLDIAQACSDYGYPKAKSGGYKLENKREIMRLLNVLTALELRLAFTPPTGKKRIRLSGHLWERGILAEEQDVYEDLMGAARVGDPNTWEPRIFRYAPGDWYSDPTWERHNRFVGKAGSGLMRLRADQDEWAILIGGYLIMLARAGRYAATRVRAETILNRTNLAQEPDQARRRKRYMAKFTKALDRLVEEGVIATWEWAAGDVPDLADDDWDDPAALTAYYSDAAATPAKGADNWRKHVVTITWPQEDEAPAFAERRRKAIAGAARKKPRPRSGRKAREEQG